MVDRARRLGQRLFAGLGAISKRFECVGDLRGRGMMAGMEIVSDRQSRAPDHRTGAKIAEEALRRGLSMNIVKLPTMGGVFRIAPPLTISEDDIDRGISIIVEAIEAATARA